MLPWQWCTVSIDTESILIGDVSQFQLVSSITYSMPRQYVRPVRGLILCGKSFKITQTQTWREMLKAMSCEEVNLRYKLNAPGTFTLLCYMWTIKVVCALYKRTVEIHHLDKLYWKSWLQQRRYFQNLNGCLKLNILAEKCSCVFCEIAKYVSFDFQSACISCTTYSRREQGILHRQFSS